MKYKVYVDETTLVYSKELVRENKFYNLNEAKVTKEMNKAGSFEFSIFENHPYFELFEPFKATCTIAVNKVNDSGEERVFFKGRVLNRKRAFNTLNTIFCEGALAFLNDGDVPPYVIEKDSGNGLGEYKPMSNFEYFQMALDNYNAEVGAYRYVFPGTFDALTSTYFGEHKEWINTLQAITNLRDRYGGYIDTRYPGKYDIRVDIKGLNVRDKALFDIVYGKNLVDFTYEEDASNLATVVRPFGKEKDNGERLDITSVNNGLNYLINTTNATKYGRIVKDVIFDKMEEAGSLMIAGADYLLKYTDLIPKITVKALDVEHLYDMDIATKVNFISEKHNTDIPVYCSKLVEHFDRPQNNEYVFITSQNNEYLKPKDGY